MAGSGNNVSSRDFKPIKYCLEQNVRSYGGSESSLITVTDPGKPARTSHSAQASPPAPGPRTTTRCRPGAAAAVAALTAVVPVSAVGPVAGAAASARPASPAPSVTN